MLFQLFHFVDRQAELTCQLHHAAALLTLDEIMEIDAEQLVHAVMANIVLFGAFHRSSSQFVKSSFLLCPLKGISLHKKF